MTKAIPLSEVGTTVKSLSARDFFNSGSEERVLIREVDGSTAAGTHEVFDIPVGAEIVSIYVRNKTAATFATGTHLGLGITGDLNKYAEILGTGIDAAGDEYWAKADVSQIINAGESLIFASTNGSGTGAGTVAGTWYVMVVIRTHSKIGA